jgi:glycosyltransferase involved in cell wall biosynthesis
MECLANLKDSIKIALVSGEYPPFSLGGISAVCNELAIGLAKKKVSTTVFTGRSQEIVAKRVSDCLTVVRMPVIDLPPRHFWFPVQNLAPLLQYLKQFDIIHFADPRAAGVLLHFRKRLKQPIVTHLHICGHCETKAFIESPLYSWSLGEFVYNLEYPLNEYLEKISLRNTDHIVVCSTARLEELKRRNPSLDYGKISVIRNGINFNKIDYNNSVSEDDCSLLFWGRMVYIKGIIQLIEAIALVKKDFPNVSLDICGKGPLDEKVKKLIEKFGLKGNIRFNGYVHNEFLVEKIKKATVIVLPSLYEGQPVSALEAMAHKKTLVVYDFPFAHEYLIDGSNGLMAKGGNTKDLAEKICIALSDKALRKKLSQNAYEHVKKYHNWDTLIEEYTKLYRALTLDSTKSLYVNA